LGVCVEVVGPETGEEEILSLSGKELNTRLQQYNQIHDLELKSLFNPFKIEPIVVDTAVAPSEPVIAFFKQRAKKLRR
ncbi:MAG: hypothetical protein IKA93_00995, partial [Elusimicrobiaceae bacterium]|nr:hypothetical protein [Elusimicrobiaceae bacterium]